jgi:hypothetical protein
VDVLKIQPFWPPIPQVSVSIYESGSSDETAHALAELVAALQALGIPSQVVWDGELRREAGEDRIEFLAKVSGRRPGARRLCLCCARG